MKTLMRVFLPLTILSVVLSTSSGQEKSDYATVQRFESRAKKVAQMTNEAQTVQECAEVAATINELEKDFQADRELLDKSLYPDKFDDRILKARVQLRIIQEKIGVIESQVQRITALETQVRELSSQVEKLSGENQQLLGDLKSVRSGVMAGSAMIDSLQKVIGKLQENIRQRDEMIFALVDSMFLQYDKDVSALKETEKSHLTGKVERSNVLTNVKRAIQDNLTFVESTQLTGSDLSKMVKEQQKFSAQWKGIGPKLAAIYISKKDRKKDLDQIDMMLQTWSAKVDTAFWRAANALFKDNNVPVKPFENGGQFVDHLLGYMNEEISNPKKESDETRFKRFTEFEEKIWKNEVGNVWIPMMAEQGKVTEQQKKDLSAKLEEWRSSASPPSFALYAAIFILIVALLAALFVRMRRSKE
ncbi:MAG: hypothetical protein WBD36_09525 [Bacteroidota bacterium]